MCGIGGFNWQDRKLAQRMSKAISHRGPDSEGYFFDDVSLIHRRLSILDLSSRGDQPMKLGEYTIVFNGEIYNFKKIARELKHKFRTSTDTEVILAAYKEWGPECVKKFNGMWAFCIYDKKKNELFLSRDRFGKKPLYYYHKDGNFMFCSEIKGILQNAMVNRVANNMIVSDYLNFDLYNHTNETFFMGILQLPASCNMIYDLKNKKLEIKKYYKLKFEENSFPVQMVEDVLVDSLMHRLVSDVPVSISLSGGVDSTTIGALMAESNMVKEMKAFTTRFEGSYEDERENVQRFIEKYPQYTLFHSDIKPETFDLKKLIYHQEEPFVGHGPFVRYKIAEKVHEKNFKVLLSGEGADEVFGGYSGATSVYAAESLRKLQLGKALGAGGKAIMGAFYFLLPRWLKRIKLRKRKDVKIFCGSERKLDLVHIKSLNEYLHKWMFKGILPMLVSYNDKMAMAHSVEGRAPFLDYSVVELGMRMEKELKYKKGYRKYILRQLCGRYLPKEIAWNMKKETFGAPLKDILMHKQIGKFIKKLNNARCEKYIDTKSVIKEYNNLEKGADMSFILKTLCLEEWLRQFNVTVR